MSNKYYQFLPSGVSVGAGMVVGTENNEETKQNQKISSNYLYRRQTWEFPFYLEVQTLQNDVVLSPVVLYYRVYRHYHHLPYY